MADDDVLTADDRRRFLALREAERVLSVRNGQALNADAVLRLATWLHSGHAFQPGRGGPSGPPRPAGLPVGFVGRPEVLWRFDAHVSAGALITDVAAEVARLAHLLGRRVEAVHNDRRMYAEPGDGSGLVLDRMYADVAAAEAAKGDREDADAPVDPSTIDRDTPPAPEQHEVERPVAGDGVEPPARTRPTFDEKDTTPLLQGEPCACEHAWWKHRDAGCMEDDPAGEMSWCPCRRPADEDAAIRREEQEDDRG